MSHPLSKYARAVQDEFERDGKSVAYQFCLNATIAHVAQGRASGSLAPTTGGPMQ